MASVKVNYGKNGEIISYRLRADLGRDPNGKQVIQTKTIKSTGKQTPAKELKAMQREADQWENALRDGLAPMGKATFEQVVSDFETIHGPNLKASTLSFYKNMKKLPFFGWVQDKKMFADEYRLFCQRYEQLNGKLPDASAEIDHNTVQMLISQLINQLYTVAQVPSVVFNGNVSNVSEVSLKLLFTQLDNKAKRQAAYLKEGFYRRWEAMRKLCREKLTDKQFDSLDVSFNFNMPVDNSAILADLLAQHEAGALSKKSLIELSPYSAKTVIRQYQMDGTFVKEFASTKFAAAEIGVEADTITNVTSGKRNSAGGFLWRRCNADTPAENIVPTPTPTLNMEGKLIYQVDQNGEIVATFESISKAEKLSGVNRRSISDALKGIQKTAGGFTWVLGDKV